ncbi:hypothetical protein [Pseudoalteromonas lipolytica]|uniref:hypothetical protein n=1 Tax=Pseudoalteromonas lipolytica TaxID=570156 RepID=UPI000826B151|nr:hypothetical protein [Pseudoalteromonas lipolytica]
MSKVNSISALIDATTVTRKDGYIVIKPLSQVLEELQLDSVTAFDNIRLWKNTSLNLTKSKQVFFGDNLWQNYEESDRNLNFNGSDELNFQIKMHALIKLKLGNFEGGRSYKISTLQNSVTYLNALANFLRTRGIRSFHQLEFLPEIKLRTLWSDYLITVAKIEVIKPTHSLTKLFTPLPSYKLFGDKTCLIFNESLHRLNRIYHKKTTSLSHPIIPTRVLSNILKYSERVIADSKQGLERWLEINNELITSITKKAKTIDLKNVCEIVKVHAVTMPSYEEFSELCSLMESLKLATYINILAFTGMRYKEVISCKTGCVTELDSTFSIRALMTKTDNTEVEMDWFCNKEVYESVSLYQQYVLGMHHRAKAILANYGNQIPNTQKHNLTEGLKMERLFGVAHSTSSVSFCLGGRFEGFEVPDNKYKSLFNLTLTPEDIEELDRLESNYKATRGELRGVPYQEGEQFILGKHKFRHTLAYFVIANKLGELDDIRYQYKHLTSLMTFVYVQRATLAAKNLISEVEGFENLLVSKIASELAFQADNQELRGGAGEQFNKASRELIIGITDSNNKNSNTLKQIHFKSLGELKLFLAKNLKGIRGLPHGYCTAGEACKIKGAAVPSNCVYCPSNIIANRHKIHWKALLNSSLAKLENYKTLTPEEQLDYELFAIHWEDSITAARYALGDTPSQPLEKSEAIIL